MRQFEVDLGFGFTSVGFLSGNKMQHTDSGLGVGVWGFVDSEDSTRTV